MRTPREQNCNETAVMILANSFHPTCGRVRGIPSVAAEKTKNPLISSPQVSWCLPHTPLPLHDKASQLLSLAQSVTSSLRLCLLCCFYHSDGLQKLLVLCGLMEGELQRNSSRSGLEAKEGAGATSLPPISSLLLTSTLGIKPQAQRGKPGWPSSPPSQAMSWLPLRARQMAESLRAANAGREAEVKRASAQCQEGPAAQTDIVLARL